MPSKDLSTGDAARLCSVTPDTVRKWIASGRLTARRTAGGHHRIARDEVERLIAPPPASVVASSSSAPRRQFQYCWEYNGRGTLINGCRQCVVFQLRAQRCYEVVKHVEAGHRQIFCNRTCAECDYFKRVHQQETNVLVVTDDAALEGRLREERECPPFNLRFANCEYTCSALVDTFRPDFAVIDCGMGADRTQDICYHLWQDPRIPFIRVILAADRDNFPSRCDREVFARIEKPFGIGEVVACISSARGAAA